MSKTTIEWADEVWNPTLGCSPAKGSEQGGCKNCYAQRSVHVRAGNPNAKIKAANEGLTVVTSNGPVWNGKVRCLPDRLDVPLHKKKPTRYFVNSLSDLFHEQIPDEFIDRVMAVIILSDSHRSSALNHTMQALTKRAIRMLSYMSDPDTPYRVSAQVCKQVMGFLPARNGCDWTPITPWPPENLWLGVSVEDQGTANARIPLLLQTPAAIRFVSYEPALGPVDFDYYLHPRCMNCSVLLKPARRGREIGVDAALPCGCKYCWHCADNRGRHEDHDPSPPHGSPVLDWIVVGGESGPGARPFDIAWARNTIEQCKDAGVACFVKQISGKPYDSEAVKQSDGYWPISEERYGSVKAFPGAAQEYALCHVLKDRKGGDMSEWPEDLRVRELPL